MPYGLTHSLPNHEELLTDHSIQDGEIEELTPKEYLRSVLPSKQEVEAFIAQPDGKKDWLSQNDGVLYNSELGWIHSPALRNHGVDQSWVQYSYDEVSLSRQYARFGGKTCRIQSYGDSYTHGDQVSDGETWQEYLASHLCEPIQNFGVGGYSVYQAFLRMKKTQERFPAEYLIFNIYSHDHFRNLASFWGTFFGYRIQNGFTLPHVRVKVNSKTVEEKEHQYKKEKDLFQLCDESMVLDELLKDPILIPSMVRRNKYLVKEDDIKIVADEFDINQSLVRGMSLDAAIMRLYQEAALFSTEGVVRMILDYAKKNHKKIKIILSYGINDMKDDLDGKPRWDQRFLDFLGREKINYIDMRDLFLKDPNIDLKTYYQGHHSPAGNFFTAWAIKDEIVKWLEPKPLPYSK